MTRENTPSTPMDITQELLALVNARREKEGQGADAIIKKLQDEISLYGDNVASTVDRSDPYFNAEKHDPVLFRNAVGRLHKKAGAIPESLEAIFKSLLSSHHPG